MKKINIRRLHYLFRHRLFTLNNVVIIIAFMIASGWVWGSLDVMQRNYALQKKLDEKSRQLVLAQLDMENAKLEQRYYKTDEYKELATREYLGLATPGESVLILPPNSDVAKNSDKISLAVVSNQSAKLSNFAQWMNFLFGGVNNRISN